MTNVTCTRAHNRIPTKRLLDIPMYVNSCERTVESCASRAEVRQHTRSPTCVESGDSGGGEGENNKIDARVAIACAVDSGREESRKEKRKRKNGGKKKKKARDKSCGNGI